MHSDALKPGRVPRIRKSGITMNQLLKALWANEADLLAVCEAEMAGKEACRKMVAGVKRGLRPSEVVL